LKNAGEGAGGGGSAPLKKKEVAIAGAKDLERH